MPLPKFVTKDGSWNYQTTPEDMLTLARALNGEESASGTARLAWSYAQRLYQVRNAFSTLAGLVLAHSQVINPAWGANGTHCRPGGDYYGKADCNAAAARDANRTKPWTALKSGVQDALYAWASGQVPNPVPRGTDFAAPALVARKIAGENPEGFRVVHQGVPGVSNTVVSTTASRRWPADDFIRLEANGRVVGVAEGLPVRELATPFALLGLAAGGWALWRGRRG
jgi:hypothetical protein